MCVFSDILACYGPILTQYTSKESSISQLLDGINYIIHLIKTLINILYSHKDSQDSKNSIHFYSCRTQFTGLCVKT